MRSKKPDTDLNNYYTAAEAAAVLSKNSRKEIKPSYLRSMARSGIVTPYVVNSRLKLYPKAEIDRYVVGARGHHLTSKGRTSKNAA